jgi:hypothetical protein
VARRDRERQLAPKSSCVPPENNRSDAPNSRNSAVGCDAPSS